MSLIVVASERFAEHQTPPGHPESPERAEVMDRRGRRVAQAARRSRGAARGDRASSSRASMPRTTSRGSRRPAGARSRSTPTPTRRPRPMRLRCLAAGAAIDAVERVMGGNRDRAFALVRPPGHHAERDRAMGFCFFNNVAVAAAHARTVGARAGRHRGLRRAPRQRHAAHRSRTTPTSSTSRRTSFRTTRAPARRARSETARAQVSPSTCRSKPAPPTTTTAWRSTMWLCRSSSSFDPDLILISAGFDAHERDPLGGMRLTTEAFAAMTADAPPCRRRVLRGPYRRGDRRRLRPARARATRC